MAGFWSTLINALPAIGEVAGSVTQERAQGRVDAAGVTMDRDAQGMQAGRDFESAQDRRAQTDLDQRKFTTDARGVNYDDALRSSVAKNVQDTSFGARPEGVPTMTLRGGMRPSAMGPEGREAADVMNRLAMEKLVSGETFDAPPPLERYALGELPQPNALDKILGGVSLLGSAAKVASLFKKPTAGTPAAGGAGIVQSPGIFNNIRFGPNG